MPETPPNEPPSEAGEPEQQPPTQPEPPAAPPPPPAEQPPAPEQPPATAPPPAATPPPGVQQPPAPAEPGAPQPDAAPPTAEQPPVPPSPQPPPSPGGVAPPPPPAEAYPAATAADPAAYSPAGPQPPPEQVTAQPVTSQPVVPGITGPEPRRRGWMLPVVIGGILLLALLAVGAYFLFFRGDAGAETPEEALRGFYAALGENDCEEAARFVDPSFVTREDLCRDLEGVKDQVGTLGQIRSQEESGDTANVVAERTLEGEVDQRIIQFQRSEDAGWRITGGSACYAVEQPEDLGNDHLAEGEPVPEYSSDPPTSGPHADAATEAGRIYPDPQPDPEVVHAMEHGAVVFWTGEGLAQDREEQLEQVVIGVFEEGYESLIITPDETLDTPLAMTAWGTLQKCVGVDEEEIGEFVNQYYGSGLEGFIAPRP